MVEPAHKTDSKLINVEKKLVGKYIFNLADKLGSGAFGVVYRGSHRDDSSIEVAIKQVPISVSDDEFDYLKTLLEREVNVMQTLSHENILKLIDISMTKNNIYLIMEFCNEGDLETRKKDMTIEEILIVIKQIVKAMVYANNEKKIIHRDLKPANILLHNGAIKVADFGFARTVDDPKIQSKLTKRIGTPLYMAPQIFRGEKYGPKCDVWSLGVLFYELIFKKPPWYGTDAQNLFKNIKDSPLDLDGDLDLDENVKDLLTKMLNQTELNRLDFDGVLKHEVFENDLPDKLPKKKKKKK